MQTDFGLAFVKGMVSSGKYFYTAHAQEKMGRLKISTKQVEECILNSHHIETQQRKDEHPKVLFYSGHKTGFYVVITVSVPLCVVVSVIEVDWSKWEKQGASIRRKRNV